MICGWNPNAAIPEAAVRRIFERIIEEMRQIQKLRMESNGDSPDTKK